MNPTVNPGFSRRSLLKLTAALPIAGGTSLLKAAEPEIKILPFNKFTDQDEIGNGDLVVAVDVPGKRRQRTVGHPDGEHRRVLERIRHREQEDPHLTFRPEV